MTNLANRCLSLVTLGILLCSVLVACDREGQALEDLPTPIVNLDDLATADFMTENAPPEGYRTSVVFERIDANLAGLSNWRYTVDLEFSGVFAGTSRPVDAETRAEVWYNNLGPERRVVVQGRGELFGQFSEPAPLTDAEVDQSLTLEGVRLGGDTFLVRDGVCLGDAEGAAALVADLRAGDLIGGVDRVATVGINTTINNVRVWRYEFDQGDLILPQIAFAQGGGIRGMRGELWIAPEHNAVIRYYVTLDVENALILLNTAEANLPVTGQIIIRYDVFDIGVNPNITQPFGC